ncbi:DDB1B, partial [Symbiodinium sp. KB8]
VYEPGAFRKLFPHILEILRHSANLQLLHLEDIYVSPIRGPSADGELGQKEAEALLSALSFGAGGSGAGRHLKELSLCAGRWTWDALRLLFRALSGSSVSKLHLRGDLQEPNAPRPLDVLGSVAKFSWQGSNITGAETLKSLLDAVPTAAVRFFKDGGMASSLDRQLWCRTRNARGSWIQVKLPDKTADHSDRLSSIMDFYVGLSEPPADFRSWSRSF